MKIKLIILLIFLLNFNSCKKDNLIQKNWISTTWTSSRDSDEYKRIKDGISEKAMEYSEAFLLHLDSMYNGIYEDKLIYQFSEDSLTITHFNETLTYGFDRDKIKYELKFDSIYLEETKNVKFGYAINKLAKKELVLSYYMEESFHQENKIIFQPLIFFNSEIKKNDLTNLLIDNKFRLDLDNTIMSFKAPQENDFGKIITSSSENILDLKMKDNWYVTKISTELFLVIDNHVIHVKDVQNERVLGLIYGDENIELLLTKVVVN